MRRCRNNGTVLIITIWVTTILAGLAITLAWHIRSQAMQTENIIAAAQADYIAKGAINYAKSKIGSEEETDGSSDGFEELELGNGHFWLIKPNLSSDREVDYGLADEAAKVNLNSASLDMLLKLPGMTGELAASIIDWRDSDSEVTTGGAENEYYLLCGDSYECKNADFETVEEVLLVKGASKEILYGEDRNVNGVLDDNENDGTNSLPNDNSNGQLDSGFYNYVTVYSHEENKTADGGDRVNAADRRSQSQVLETLKKVISEDDALVAISKIRAKQNYENIIDVYYTSGIEYDDFLQLADLLTTTDEEEISGLINVNSAPKEVLSCLPELEDKDVDELIKKREKLEDEEKSSVIWVTEVLDKEKAIAIGSFITTKSSQYSADVVAITDNGRAFRRYKAVIDTTSSPSIVYRKSLSELGWPLDKDVLETRNQDLEFRN